MIVVTLSILLLEMVYNPFFQYEDFLTGQKTIILISKTKKMLRLIVMSSVAACSLAANTKTRVLIEKATIKQFAHDTGIASLLEREGHNMNLGEKTEGHAIMEIPTLEATGEEVQSGNFEIKCATKCDFVKSGAAEFAGDAGLNGAGEAGIQAAQVLENQYLQMAKLQDQLAADPTNEGLVSQRQTMQAKINSQTALLNAVAGGGATQTPVSANDEARLAGLKERLESVMGQLSGSPDDAPLMAMRDQLRSEISDRQKAVDAESVLQSRRKEVMEKIAKYDAQLDKLKAEASAVPNDAKLSEEIGRVQKAKDAAVSSQAVSNPSKECLDICAKSKGSQSNDKECVVTCITTLRTMSYKLAKMFL